jgi:hypothetical protein
VVPALQFGCPFCGAVSEVDASQAGQETVCPACDNVLLVPQAADSPATGVEIVPVEELHHPARTGKPKPTKNKLWQKRSAAAEAQSLPVEADLPQQVITRPAVDPLSPKSLPRSDVVDLSSDGEGSGFGPDVSHRAERVVRDERERRRAISNAVMLVGSIAILIGALAGLMWLSGK